MSGCAAASLTNAAAWWVTRYAALRFMYWTRLPWRAVCARQADCHQRAFMARQRTVNGTTVRVLMKSKDACALGEAGARRRGAPRSTRATWRPSQGSAPAAQGQLRHRPRFPINLSCSSPGGCFIAVHSSFLAGSGPSSPCDTDAYRLRPTPGLSADGSYGNVRGALVYYRRVCHTWGERAWLRRSRGTSMRLRIFMNRQRSFSTTPGSGLHLHAPAPKR